MALIKSVRGFTPEIGENCFLADNAVVIGDVKMGRDCSIWFSTVLRGDVNSIRIGNGVNIQDGSVLHTLYEKSTIEIGDHVSVGHNVTIHGATIKNYALVGMGSTILDHAVVGEGAIVAAGSLVLSNTVIEPDRRTRRYARYGHRAGKHLGRSPRQVHQESRSGAGQGAEPEDCTQLSDVFRLVQIKGDKAPQKGRAIKGCHSITFTALSLLSLFTFLKVYHTHYLIRCTGVAGHIIACIHA